MRRIFWLMILVGAYLWVLTSGNDEWITAKAKSFYETLVSWIDQSDRDFHLNKDKHKKKHRRY